MAPPRYRIRLMFEWGGGALWCGNDAARECFGVGPIEARLPLPSAILARLDELGAWHDQSLNAEYPPDPGPWTPEEQARFHTAAREVRAGIQDALGPEFDVVYEPL
jgi:hypothetical protein